MQKWLIPQTYKFRLRMTNVGSKIQSNVNKTAKTLLFFGKKAYFSPFNIRKRICLIYKEINNKE